VSEGGGGSRREGELKAFKREPRRRLLKYAERRLFKYAERPVSSQPVRPRDQAASKPVLVDGMQQQWWTAMLIDPGATSPRTGTAAKKKNWCAAHTGIPILPAAIDRAPHTV
jgi:hypothetical protein